MPAEEQSMVICNSTDLQLTYQAGGILMPALRQCFNVGCNYFENMTPLEIYNQKRKNFVAESVTIFNFLICDLQYDHPEIIAKEHSDTINFINTPKSRIVTLFNAYHPYDYGFEFRISKVENQKADNEVMWTYVLKEDQDIEQSYLRDIGQKAKEEIPDILAGSKWFEEE